jgi:hypothetical protein
MILFVCKYPALQTRGKRNYRHPVLPEGVVPVALTIRKISPKYGYIKKNTYLWALKKCIRTPRVETPQFMVGDAKETEYNGKDVPIYRGHLLPDSRAESPAVR